MRPAAFLDRDGVLLRLARNADGSRRGARSRREAVLIVGVAPAVQALADDGYIPIVVTNQPDVGRGLQTLAQLSKVHGYLRSRLAIADIYVCCHEPGAGCGCRKPSPGMLLAAASHYGLDISASVMFGDRRSDQLAARASGCGFCWITADAQDDVAADWTGPTAGTLSEAVTAFLADHPYRCG